MASHARIDQLAAAMQLPLTKNADQYLHVLKGATDDAMLAILNYYRALPFLETANSLIENLAKPSPYSEDDEWRDQLLFRLTEVLETGANVIGEGEMHLDRSHLVQI